jgi:3'-5' exonuclease
MPANVIVWDLETVPDLRGFAAANDLEGKSDDEIRAAMGDKFPKHLYHSIACIGALIAHRDDDCWVVDALGAPHIGERTEKELITSFVDKIAALNPQLVTFNGNSFDLPVLRYRAMVHEVPAIGLSARPYFNRYSDDAVDLCDALSSFSSQAKVSLHELCRVMGLPGKPDSIDGSEVHAYFRDGRIKEIADYCETDIINTYRVWLRYEQFRGKLTPIQFQLSEQKLAEFIKMRAETKPHLVGMV